MSSINTLHNRGIPMLPAGQRSVLWLPVGHVVAIDPTTALSLQAERQADDDVASAFFLVVKPNGARFRADSPESLLFLTTEAVVRVIESDDRGPRRALVEIGDMVAYPHLRELAA